MRDVILAIPNGVSSSGVVAQLTEHRWNILSVASSRNQLLEALKAAPKAVVILSERFENASLHSLMRTIYRLHPRANLILWTFSLASALDFKYRHPAIVGYYYRNVETQELLRGCQIVALGQRFASPYLTKAFKRYRNYKDDSQIFAGLSVREIQIFQMITGGITVAEIAERLVISRKTVNTFRYRLFEKLNLKSDVQLAHLAIKHGLIEPQY